MTHADPLTLQGYIKVSPSDRTDTGVRGRPRDLTLEILWSSTTRTDPSTSSDVKRRFKDGSVYLGAFGKTFSETSPSPLQDSRKKGNG